MKVATSSQPPCPSPPRSFCFSFSYRTGQDSTGQDSTGQDRTGQDMSYQIISKGRENAHILMDIWTYGHMCRNQYYYLFQACLYILYLDENTWARRAARGGTYCFVCPPAPTPHRTTPHVRDRGRGELNEARRGQMVSWRPHGTLAMRCSGAVTIATWNCAI